MIEPVIEEEIDIRTADGTSDAVLYRPAPGAAARPGVVHLTDIGGIRASHRQMARRLAEQGYTVLMPNFFYRLGRPPMYDRSLDREDPRVQARLAELRTHFTPEMVERDAASYVDFLAAHEGVARGPMGVVGYCLSGSMAMRTAAVRPERIAAAASFHGGGLFTDTPASPHLALPRIKARLYFAHAVKDRIMPEEAIAQLDRALESWGGTYESEIYDEAYHSWTMPDSPVYNQPQAERAFEKLTALFADTLTRARSLAR